MADEKTYHIGTGPVQEIQAATRGGRGMQPAAGDAAGAEKMLAAPKDEEPVTKKLPAGLCRALTSSARLFGFWSDEDVWKLGEAWPGLAGSMRSRIMELTSEIKEDGTRDSSLHALDLAHAMKQAHNAILWPREAPADMDAAGFHAGDLALCSTGGSFRIGLISQAAPDGADVFFHEDAMTEHVPACCLHSIKNADAIRQVALGGELTETRYGRAFRGSRKEC